MERINLQPRRCECCGGNDLTPVLSGEEWVRRAKNTWHFPYSIAVCRTCGFAFNSPAPRENDLMRFYADGLTGYKKVGLPYSIDARVEVLKKYSVRDGVFAEIGGDQPGEFHRRVTPLFSRLVLVDVGDDCSSELKNVNQLEEHSIDVIAHYDVLEHVSSIKKFLSHCYRALKSSGVMICEVPNIRLYPRNLLLQEFTHVNHFSTTTLLNIAGQVGLVPIQLIHQCSRPYGFLAVFQKKEEASQFVPSPYEYLDALACLRGGMKQIELCVNHIEAVRKQINIISSEGKKITIWGVTDLLRSLVKNLEINKNVLVVDADPRRINHLSEFGIQVDQPQNTIEHIKKSELLVICAPRYKNEILEWISNKANRTFVAPMLQVIGGGPSGETLR